MRNVVIKRCLLWLLTLLAAFGIFLLSEQSAEQSSALSGAVTQGLLGNLFSLFHFTEEQRETAHELVRSLAHVGSFAVLGVFASMLVKSYRCKRWIVVTVACCAAYALFDEYHQLWNAAGRAFEWADVAKDSFGAWLGALVVLAACHGMAWYRRRRKVQREGS